MISIREADAKDNAELLALTRATPMSGRLSLRIDREPDFFRLLKLRGAGKVFAAISDGRIAGCISVTFPTVYVHGEPQIICYAGDLRVHPAYSGSRVALELTRTVRDCVTAHDRKCFCFCIVASENQKALSLLLKQRRSFPKFESLGRFGIYQVFPSPLQSFSRRYEITEATDHDLAEVCDFCNRFNKSYLFGPVKTESDFRLRDATQENSSSQARILVARLEKKIVATLCQWDGSAAKQTVVAAMPKFLRLTTATLARMRKVLPLYTFPRVGEVVRTLHLRNIAYDREHRDALRTLLQRVRNDAFGSEYSFISIGLHERDPLKFLVRGLPKYTFSADSLIGSPDPDHLATVRSEIPVEDFALV